MLSHHIVPISQHKLLATARVSAIVTGEHGPIDPGKQLARLNIWMMSNVAECWPALLLPGLDFGCGSSFPQQHPFRHYGQTPEPAHPGC